MISYNRIMADLEEVRIYALNKMQEWGLLDWTFQYDRSVRRFGRCSHKRKLISLSHRLTALNFPSDAHDCVLHEIAHAISPPNEGHGAVWKRNAIRVGADPSRTYGEHVIQPKRPWQGVCPHCKTVITRFRRRRIACSACCQKYNKGRFDPRFLFQWSQSQRNPENPQEEQQRLKTIQEALQRGDRESIQSLLTASEKALITLYDYLTENKLLRRTRLDADTSISIIQHFYQALGYSSDPRAKDSFLSPSGKTKIKFLSRNLQVFKGGRGAWTRTTSLSLNQAALDLIQKATGLFGHQQAEVLSQKKMERQEKSEQQTLQRQQKKLDNLFSLWVWSKSLTPEERLAWQQQYLDDPNTLEQILGFNYSYQGSDQEDLEKLYNLKIPPLFTGISPKEVRTEVLVKDKMFPVVYRREDNNILINIGALPLNPISMRMGFVSGMGLEGQGVVGYIKFIPNKEPRAYLFMILSGDKKRGGLGRHLVRAFCQAIQAYGLTHFIAEAVGKEGAKFFQRLHQTGELGIQAKAGHNWLISCQDIFHPEQGNLFKLPKSKILTYIGQCDQLRKLPQGEQYWQRMMALKKPVSLHTFEEVCDTSALLDEGEGLEQFLADDPDSGIYTSFWGDRECMFVQTSGFEFIFA